MKKVYSIFMILLATVLSGCPADAPESIELSGDQSASVSLSYDSTSSTINFEAEGEWFATITPINDNDTSWLHLDQTSGSAGNIVLNFTMDENYTGSSRSARVVISCMDTSVTVTVTQLAEGETPDDGDEDGDDNEGDSPVQRLPQIDILYSRTNHLNMDQEEGRMSIVFDGWESPCPIDIIVNTTYEEDGQEVMSEQSYRYTYEGNTVNVNVEFTKEGYVIDRAEYQLTMENGRGISGYSKYQHETRNYRLNYDSNGYLTKFEGNTGSSSLVWNNGNFTSASDPWGSQFQIRYNENCINSNAYNFDPNWLIASTLTSVLNDDAYFFAMFGMVGNASKNLISEITRENSGYYYTIDYNECNEHRIKCTVSDYYNDELIATSMYIIRF